MTELYGFDSFVQSRPERRFLVSESFSDYLVRLAKPRIRARVYEVETYYLDELPVLSEIDGTRARIRHYLNTGEWYLELKRNVDGLVSKWRSSVNPLHHDNYAWRYVVAYERFAIDGPGWRVTVDRNVTANYRTVLNEWDVLEVKGIGPDRLEEELPPESKMFSKYGFASRTLQVPDIVGHA